MLLENIPEYPADHHIAADQVLVREQLHIRACGRTGGRVEVHVIRALDNSTLSFATVANTSFKESACIIACCINTTR